MKFSISMPNPVYLANKNPFKKSNFETKEPIVTANGDYLWQVDGVAPNERGIEEVSVTIESQKNPVEGLELMTPLAFKDLVLTIGKMNGKKFYSLKAASVKAA